MQPLLAKKKHFSNGNAVLSIATWQALLGGILVGVGMGAFLSMFFFASITLPRNGEKDRLEAAELFRKIDETPNKNVEKTQNHSINSESIVQEFVNQELAPAQKEPELRLNEGHREISEDERKGGWRLTPDVLKVAPKHPKAKVLSESSPLLIQFKSFLSQNEIEHILNTASSHLTRSKVVSGKNGSEKDVRTSYGAWLNGNYRDEVIVEIEKRIHDAIGIPFPFGEGIYVLRYETEQKYDPHTDNCARHGETPREACLNFLKRAGGPLCGENHGGASCGDRIATFIMYLKAPEKGGATVFPQSRITKERIKKSGRQVRASGFADYCNSPLYFKLLPEAGDALLFWDYIPKPEITDHETFVRSGSYEWTNQTTEAVNDGGSLHGGCPVLEGEKWIATKWIRSAYFA